VSLSLIVRLSYLYAKLGAVALGLCLVKLVTLYSLFVAENLFFCKGLIRFSEGVELLGFRTQVPDFSP
jgi:hypothetical protein